jgi:hypothetical protein
MKALVPSLCLVAGALHADEEEVRDPLDPSPNKTAAELVRCANGHKTLTDIPIVYGHIGGLRSDPETAAKAERGEIILGGDILGTRNYWIVCRTCGLHYEDDYAAWQEDHPRGVFIGDGGTDTPCTPELVKRILSAPLNGFPTDFDNCERTDLACSRWLNDTGVVGDAVYILLRGEDDQVISELEKWLSNKGEIAEDRTRFGPRYRVWKWKSGDRDWSLFLRPMEPAECSVEVVWHKRNTANPDGADHPATAPESKPEENQNPIP